MTIEELLKKSKLNRLVFIDSDEKIHKSADKVMADIIMLQNEFLNAFLIEWVDYLDSDTFCDVLDQTKELNKALPWHSKMKFVPTTNGIFVTTYRNWVLDTFSDDFDKYNKEHGVYSISIEELNKYLFMPIVGHSPDDNIITGTEHIIHCRLNSNSSVLRRMSCEDEVAVEMYENIEEALPEYKLGLWDIKKNKKIGNEVARNIIVAEKVLDPNVNLSEHIKFCKKENISLYEEGAIIAKLLNLL